MLFVACFFTVQTPESSTCSKGECSWVVVSAAPEVLTLFALLVQKLQILTLGGASKGIRYVCGLFLIPLLQFTCFTGTNVRILTMRFARKAIRDVFGFLIPLLFVAFLLGTRFTRFTSTKGYSMYSLY